MQSIKTNNTKIITWANATAREKLELRLTDLYYDEIDKQRRASTNEILDSFEYIMSHMDEYEHSIDELDNIYAQYLLEMGNTLEEKQFSKFVKYKLNQRRAKLKEAKKRIAKRNKEARTKRQLNKLQDSNNPIQMMRAMSQLMRAQQKVSKINQQTIKDNPIVLKYPQPKTYEEDLENIEPLKNDSRGMDNYNVAAGILRKKWKENKFGSQATRELTSEFMMPSHADVIEESANMEVNHYNDFILKNTDGSPMDYQQMFAASHRVKQWVNTEEEQAIEDKRKAFDLMSPEEQQRVHEQYLEEQKEAQEARRLELEEWEKTQRIKRMADKLINAAKAKEEIKCLIPKKSDVASVEEQLGNTE